METGSVLAEALVKVKLVYDGADIKQQATNAAELQGRALKNQISTLRSEGRSLRQVGMGINKAAAVLFKTIVAPALLLGGLGIRKYMQSTEKGAAQLRTEVKGLTKSWDQFLGRVGRVIYNSGILTKVIDKLKNILNGLDDKKIGQIFNIAKWAAILYIFMKITAFLTTWGGLLKTVSGNILNLAGAGYFGKGVALKVAGAAVGPAIAQGVGRKGLGEVAEGAAGSVAGPAVGTALGYGGGVVRSTKEFKSFRRFEKQVHARHLSQGGTGKVVNLQADYGVTASKPATQAAASASKIGGLFNVIAKYFTIILIGVDFLRGFLKELGVKWADTASAFEFLKKILGYVWQAVTGVFNAMSSFVVDVGAMWASTLKFIFTSIALVLKGEFKNAMVNFLAYMGDQSTFTGEHGMVAIFGRAYEEFLKGLTGYEKIQDKGKKEKKLDWLSKQPPKAVSFAGLQQAAQEMITGDNTTATKDNTDAIKANTAALLGAKPSEKGNAFLGVMNNMIDTSAFQASQLPYGVTAVSRGMAY